MSFVPGTVPLAGIGNKTEQSGEGEEKSDQMQQSEIGVYCLN